MASKNRTIFVLTFAAVGVVCLVVGIVLISGVDEKRCSKTEEHTSTSDKKPEPEQCAPSQEAKRSGFDQFLQKVQNASYEEYPYLYSTKTGLTREQFIAKFKAYNPRPEHIKQTTDRAWKLLAEIKSLGIQVDQLKPREKKALSQLKHYLQHIFGVPYDANYYTGDFMLGPNSFCYQKICRISYDIYNALVKVKPKSLSDMDTVQKILVMHKEGIAQYMENMKLGVRSGMVRALEDCKASLDALQRSYWKVTTQGQSGILDEWFCKYLYKKEYFSLLKPEDIAIWNNRHGKTINESMKDWILETIGKSLHELLSYYKDEHLRHCIPSNVASGLASLPVDFVYIDGKANTSLPTNKTLPCGRALNGSKAYELILSFFTTNNMTATEINKLGEDMIKILYPQILQVARQFTKENDTETAKQEFLKVLNSSEMFFNEKPLPEIESNGTAHEQCTSLEKAKLHCPERWKAFDAWVGHALKVMSFLDAKTSPMFYFSGDRTTTPGCPLQVKPTFVPSRSVPTYSGSDKSCSKPAVFNVPFFLKNLGPRYMEYTINAHEARPGHHTQIQGLTENFGDTCTKDVIAWLGKQTLYTAFVEGWGLYSEYPLMAEYSDAYEDNPLMHYGMLKSQVWRAVRLIVDTNLHFFGGSRADALKVFEEYMWDTSDQAQKEVTRYQSVPGQALSYMIGQLQIIKLRNYTKSQLGSNFNQREFHYQVLSQGASPLSYLESHIKKYVSCTLNEGESGCEYITGITKPKVADTRNFQRRSRSVQDKITIGNLEEQDDMEWPIEPIQEIIF